MQEVLRHDETALPFWCADATAGFAGGLPTPIAAQHAGMILAYAVVMGSELSGGLRAALFFPLLQGSRLAARALGLEDMLPTAVETLKDIMEEAYGIPEGLDAEDRSAALQVLLRPPRP